ncbi:MAG: HlyC/CorC family transporter [Acidobacteria bacterium]|nr:MAG: HlyC/CorC family transporter [Acidobacteriota bacterium]
MEIIGFLLGTLFFILLEAFFAGSEIALVSTDRSRISILHRRTGYGFLRDFYENPEEYITLTMLGYTISIVLASTFYTLAVLKLGEYLPLLRGAEVLFSATLVIFTLMLGEIVPKSLFQKHKERLIVPSLWFLSKMKIPAKPLLVASRKMSRVITENLRSKHREDVEKESLLKFMEELSQREEKLKLALRILSMKDLLATEEIKPITEVVMAEEKATIEQVMSIMKESGYRRLPVYRRRVDQIVGYVDLFDLISNRHARFIRELIRPVHYFSEFTTLERVFEAFTNGKEQMGVVVDERGNIIGIITWDDLQSYVLGLSEGHGIEEEELLEVEKDKWIVDGGLERERFEKILGIDLPDGPYTTVGGFLSFYMKRIPNKGEVIEYMGYRFKVIQRDERRITKVLVEKNVQEQ